MLGRRLRIGTRRFGLKWMAGRTKPCAKCKKAPPAGDDSWCLFCSAVENLNSLARESWCSAGYRQIAEDLVVDIARSCKGLLVLDRRTRSLVDSYSNRPQHPWQKNKQGLQIAPKAGAKPALVRSPKKTEEATEVKEETEAKDTEEAEEERREQGTGSLPSSSSRATKPPEPEGPPPERRRSRSRHRGRRGGQRHQQLFRGLQDPELKFHRRLKDEPRRERRR